MGNNNKKEKDAKNQETATSGDQKKKQNQRKQDEQGKRKNEDKQKKKTNHVEFVEAKGPGPGPGAGRDGVSPAGRFWVLDEEEERQKKRDVKKDFVMGAKLGEGSYGKVRIGTCKKTKRKVAIKCVLKKNMRREKTLKREISIMKSVQHPNIIQMLDVYEDEAFIYIIMELCTGGELFDRIIQAGYYTEADAKKLLSQMLQAVAYLHEKKIAHRDLKPENFIFESKSKDAALKLIDFGLSRFYKENVALTTRVGTPYYISPETLRKQYDKACDLWSIGCILYILLCGYPPFYGNSEKEIYSMIKRGVYDFPDAEWKSVSKEAKHLISRLLDVDPSTRITAQQALNHPWMTGMPLETLFTNEGDVSATAAAAAVAAVASSIVSNDANSQNNVMQQQDGSGSDVAGQGTGQDSSENTTTTNNNNKKTTNDNTAQSTNQKPPIPPRPHDQEQQETQETENADNMTDAKKASEKVTSNEPKSGNLANHPSSSSSTSSSSSSSSSLGSELITSNQSDSRVINPRVVKRLKKFAKLNKFKRAALGVIVRYLNRDEINGLREQFESIDKDGNGIVTVSELAQAMKQCGLDPTTSEVERVLATVDEDGDGIIDYEEFLAASMDRHTYLRDELLETAFHYFDTSGDGMITREDLKIRLGDDTVLVNNILNTYDDDKSGALNFQEFCRMMKTRSKSQ